MELVIVVLLVAILGLLAYLLMRKPPAKEDDRGMLLLQQQMQELARAMDTRLGEGTRTMNESVRNQFQESQRLISNIQELMSRQLTEVAKANGAKGMAYVYVEEGRALRGPIVKFLSDAEQSALVERTQAEPGDLVVFAADAPAVVAAALGALRTEFIVRLKPQPSTAWAAAWVIEFPLFEIDPESKQITYGHNPFSLPTDATIGLLAPFLAVFAVHSFSGGDFGGFDRWSECLWRGDGSLYGGGSDANYPVVGIFAGPSVVGTLRHLVHAHDPLVVPFRYYLAAVSGTVGAIARNKT